MKLLFIHDGTLKYDEHGNYYGTAVTPNSLFRYNYLSNDITIVIRTYPFKADESRSQYMKIPQNYKIKHVDNYMSVKGIIFKKPKIKKYLKNLIDQADLVICRFSGKTGEIAANICQKKKKVYIVECVGCTWDSYWNYNLKGKLIAPYEFFYQKKLIKNAPYVIYVTNKFLQKRYPTRGKWISASNVELNPMEISRLKDRIYKIKRESGDKILILGTAAAIDVRYKGQAYVLEAMSILKKEGLTFKYQVIGSGKKDYLQRMAKKFRVEENFEILGTVPHDKVFEWLDLVDIYVQPSNQEGLPRSLIEAMSRGCPSIGSSTAGIPELLHNKVIFKRKKVDKLVSILRNLSDRNERIEQASINYENALCYQREFIYERRNIFFDMIINETNLKEK